MSLACHASIFRFLLVLAGHRYVVGIKNVTNTSRTCYPEQQWRDQGIIDFTGIFERCGPDLVCVKGHELCEDYCNVDEECQNYPFRSCDPTTFKCHHKNLFQHPAGPDVGAAFLFWFISGLALSAGIGGGGLYVPIMMISLKFTVKEATAVSQALLAGGASTAFVYNLRQRHPSGLKPMIDYTLVLVMGPNLLIGAIIGSILNLSAPSWLILVFLTIVLGQAGWKALSKAIQTWKKERVEQVSGKSHARLSKNPIERCIRFVFRKRYAEFNDADSSATASNAPPPQMVGVDSADAGEIQIHVSKDSGQVGNGPPTTPASELANSHQHNQYPIPQLTIFACVWVLMIIHIFVRGGRTVHGLVTYCSALYWLIGLAMIIALACVSIFSVKRALAEANGTTPHSEKDGPQWTLQLARQIILWSVLAGTLAAMCGIGGGMIMGPQLLNLGFLPQVQSATTGTTLFMLSTTTAISFIVAGSAPIDYSFFLAFVTGLGALLGKAVIGYIVKKFQRPSVIMFLLSGIIITSLVVMFITGTIDVVNDINQGQDLAFESPCNLEA